VKLKGESETAAGLAGESIIDKALFKEEIDEEGNDVLNKCSSEKESGLGDCLSRLHKLGGTEEKDAAKAVPKLPRSTCSWEVCGRGCS
jgi:hypothetical protein